MTQTTQQAIHHLQPDHGQAILDFYFIRGIENLIQERLLPIEPKEPAHARPHLNQAVAAYDGG